MIDRRRGDLDDRWTVGLAVAIPQLTRRFDDRRGV